MVSLLSWEISSAHFNPIITIASYIFEGNYKKNSGSFMLILLMQLIGAVIVGCLSWILEPPKLCPHVALSSFAPSAKSADEPNKIIEDCALKGYETSIIMYELIGSLCLAFSWVVLRNYRISSEYANKKFAAFLKSALVGMIYYGSVSFGFNLTNWV